MKLNINQCLLVIAAAVSIIMLWVTAYDKNIMAIVFAAEAVLSIVLLAMSTRRRIAYRTEEEYCD